MTISATLMNMIFDNNMKKAPFIIITLYMIISVFYLSASEPDTIDLYISDNSVNNIKITDRPKLLRPVDYDDYIDTIHYLNLPLVSVKNEKFKTDLTREISMDMPEIRYLYLTLVRLPRKYKFNQFYVWNLRDVFCDEDLIGYMQIDSMYIFIDKSAKSSVRKIKGHDKAFEIKLSIRKTPYNVDPYIINVPK